jgi:hypothetical protein
VRTPQGEQTLEGGALVRFPPGRAGAHKIMNRSEAPARTLASSNAGLPAVSGDPDSNTIGVWVATRRTTSSSGATAPYAGVALASVRSPCSVLRRLAESHRRQCFDEVERLLE